MFAPVTKATHGSLRPATSPRPRPPRSRAALTPPARPVYLGDRRPTCWRAEVRTALPPARARRGAATGSTAAPRGCAEAERPLIWVGGGARDARRRGRAAGRAARRAGASPPTARPACCRPTHPCLVGHAAARRPAGRAVGRGRRRVADRLRPRRRADPELRDAAAADADRDQPRPRGRGQELPRRRRARRATRARVRAALAERGARRATGSTRCAERLHEVRAAPAARSTGARCGSSTRCASRCPTTRSWSPTCASPATGWPASSRRRRRARLQIPLGWGTLGYAFPAALGAALAGAGPVGRGGRRRRLPVRLRRAGDDGAGEDPADRRDRRRRRLRDAALRPGRGGRERYGVDLHTPDFAALAARVRRSAPQTVDGLDDEFGEALAAARGRPRAVACWWRARRTRSCRRPTRRRTGTAAAR